jgi:two-component system NtrC family sensor kinase
MAMIAEPILIVDDDPFVLGLLTHVGEGRGLQVVGVRTADEAEAAMAGRPFGVAIVDLRLGSESGLDLVKRLRARDASIETIVISADRRLSSALESFEQDVFAFLPKPLDPAHVFATVERAMERRRDAVERRRLTWELALLNEVAEIVASSLEIDAVLQRAVDRLLVTFDSQFAFVRLTPITGGRPVVTVGAGIAPAQLEAIYREVKGRVPSDEVFETGRPVRVGAANKADYGSKIPPDISWQCTISVPITAGPQLLGVITLVSSNREAFSDDDERILVTIGRQFGVAVANAQLYQRVHRAKVEWERTFDAISDPIAVFDAERRTMRVNVALAALRGWRITETQGRACSDTGLCGADGPECLVGRALADGRQHSQEVVTTDERIFAVTALPVQGAAAVVLFAKEVTEERLQARRLRALSAELTTTNAKLTVTVDRLQATQMQLVQSEKLSAIGQLVAGVAHELNNPLTSVIGYAQLVQEAIGQHPELSVAADSMLDDIARVLSESDRAARIVRNLLTFARRQTSERTRTDLADLCRRVVALRTYDHQVRHLQVAVELAEDLPPVYIDDGQIQQALLNLILNAEQALRGEAEPRLRLRLIAEPASSSLLVSVTDSGHGIDPENLPRVFDPFFTTRGVGEGTGLGLSIVYGIVRDHGGQIWVESAKGETTFFVRLPARFSEEPGQPRQAAIVAHGDGVSRDFFVAVLAGWGYSVRSAANVRDALEQVRGGDADLLVLDPALVEPDVAVWREVWAKGSTRMRLLALDAPAIKEDAARFLREAATAVVAPPFDLPNIWAATLATPRRAN